MNTPWLEHLLQLSRDILQAAQQGQWETVNALTAEREQLLLDEAAQQAIEPASEASWREVDRLNREAQALAEAQLQQLSLGVQSLSNQQRLKQRYGG